MGYRTVTAIRPFSTLYFCIPPKRCHPCTLSVLSLYSTGHTSPVGAVRTPNTCDASAPSASFEKSPAAHRTQLHATAANGQSRQQQQQQQHRRAASLVQRRAETGDVETPRDRLRRRTRVVVVVFAMEGRLCLLFCVLVAAAAEGSRKVADSEVSEQMVTGVVYE